MSQPTTCTVHRGDPVQDPKEGQCGPRLEWEGDEAGEVGGARGPCHCLLGGEGADGSEVKWPKSRG